MDLGAGQEAADITLADKAAVPISPALRRVERMLLGIA